MRNTEVSVLKLTQITINQITKVKSNNKAKLTSTLSMFLVSTYANKCLPSVNSTIFSRRKILGDVKKVAPFFWRARNELDNSTIRQFLFHKLATPIIT